VISVIDYGCGNTHAFINVFKRLNLPVNIARTVAEVEKSDKIVLPGVGSFDYVMNSFNKSGLRDIVEQKVMVEKIDVIGICAGMQIFAETSDEGNEKGLGWVNGKIRIFNVKKINHKTKLPHMGWNTVNPVNNQLFEGIDISSRFYFVHSYYFANSNPENIAATTNYAGLFTSAVKRDNIYGVQFHPEKSHENGLQLLKNFAEL
jgi:imidazole glycerol-phosphate synthase subunit HisH